MQTRHFVLVLAACALASLARGGEPAPAASSAAIPAKVEAKVIPNYVQVSPQLASAGQPSDEALAELKSMGFGTVVSLRTEDEGPKGEEAAVKAAGLDFVRVPVKPEGFSAAEVDALQKALAAAGDKPVLVHCASGNRVGALLAAIEARKGTPVEEAIRKGKDWGMTKPATEEATRKFIAAEAGPHADPGPGAGK